MTKREAGIENNLAVCRQKRGVSASHLARQAGGSRQTIYAIEGGSYVPNTALALRLARVLEVGVEDLFSLSDDFPAPELRTEQVTLLSGAQRPQPGPPVQLCRVDRRVVATTPSPISWYFPASDAVVSGKSAERGKAKVQVFQSDRDFGNRILVAGCDPAISILARHVQTA